MFQQKLNILSIAILTSSFMMGCQHTAPSSGNEVISDGVNHDEGIKEDAESVKDIQLAHLINYKWQLISAVDSNNHQITKLNRINDQVKLNFHQRNNENSIGFTVGCNAMGSGFTINENVLQVGSIIATQMFCDESLNEAENILSSSMQGNSQLVYRMDEESSENNPILTQITDEGNTLIWRGKETPEAKYQQMSEIVFWEIDHDAQLCPDGSTQTCLKVRQVYYDNQGIKKGVGDWELFVGEIEGYTHDSSLDRVLRLKRFSIDPVDVKGKQYVYVLDRVVESSVAN